MIQQGQVFKLQATCADGEPLWAYRYRVAGRGSARLQVGGFSSKAEAQRALAWSPEGVLVVVIEGGGSYVLPPSRALWIPAGTVHETRSSGAAVLRSVYLEPPRCPIDWKAPTPVAVSPLLGELIHHLDDRRLGADERSHSEALLFDLLLPLRIATIDVRSPSDPRARDVADGLLADPADPRTLQEWGHAVGASSRTLARTFLSDTGLSFGHWRTLIRLQASLPYLAQQTPVSSIARLAGTARRAPTSPPSAPTPASRPAATSSGRRGSHFRTGRRAKSRSRTSASHSTSGVNSAPGLPDDVDSVRTTEPGTNTPAEPADGQERAVSQQPHAVSLEPSHGLELSTPSL